MSSTRLGIALSGLLGLVLLAAGCATGTDDELAPPPTRTVTATPSQSLAPAPATVPVGHGKVSPADVVWVQGSVLHVGRRQVDLGAVDPTALVTVDGGVFVLADGELWFTDLQRLRGTAQTQVTQLRVSADAGQIVVTDTRSGSPLEQAYDTRTGKAIRGQVDVLTPQEFRAGPGVHAVSKSGVPASFRLRGWTSDQDFYGVAGRSVLTCDAVRHQCTPVARATGSNPLVFGGGI